MAKMNLVTISQTKPSIGLNDFPQNVTDRIRVKLVPAPQTSVNYFTIHLSLLRNRSPKKSLPGISPT
jgi:hypothetical protein